MKLLYLVEEYPFGTVEHFPHLECSYLAREFDEVFVVPTNPPGDTLQYALPRNVVPSLEIARAVLKNLSMRGFARKKLLSGALWPLINELRRPFVSGHSDVIAFWAEATAIYEALAQSASVDQYDVYYSFWLSPAAHSLARLKKGRSSKVAISRAHQFDLYAERRGKKELPFQRALLQQLDHVFPCSKDGARYLVEKFPTAKAEISERYLGVETPGTVSRTSTDNVFQLVSCSQLSPVKRIDLLKEALKYVKRKLQWTHFGGGSQLESLREQVRELPSNVKVVLKGYVPNQEVLHFYQTQPVDLFLNVSLFEGLPVSVMEAMSFGIPVCATNVGGMSEIVNAQNGYLLNVSSTPMEIAAVIDRHSLEASQMRHDARNTFLTTFRAEKNFASFASELRRMAEAR